MVVTGVLFLIMPFCAIPICCRKSEDEFADIENKENKKKNKNKGKEGEEDFDDPNKIQGSGNENQANNMA